MDDELEENISLSNLHYGLESSADDTGGSGVLDQTVSGSHFVGAHDGAVPGNHINLLQTMVVEMKEGFQKALEELTKIQDKEDQEVNYRKRLQHQQQQQLDHLLENIGDIKQQLSSLGESVEQIREEHQMLKDRLEEVRGNRVTETSHAHSERNKVNIPEDSTAHLTEWFTEQPSDGGDHDVSVAGMKRANNDLAASALKVLSLTQTLGEKSHKFDISQSSNEEDDEEIKRMTGCTKQKEHFVLDQAGDRLHTMNSRTRGHIRSINVQSAAERQKVVTELTDSERDYCSQLWSLLHTYLTPLQSAGFLCPEVLDILFPPYLELLYREHCHICTGLQDKLIHWSQSTTVTDLLVKVMDSHSSNSLMSLYKEYTDDLPEALMYLRRALAESQELRLFLKAARHSSCHSDDLMSLLLAPTQRMPRYLLHLQEIYHHTPPTHTDYPCLQTHLHLLQSFVDQLNDEVFIMLQDLNQDRHARSVFMSGHTLGARNRGFHPGFLEEDNLSSASALSRARRSYLPEDRLQNVIHQRQEWDPPVHTSTLSQPNLTACNSNNNMNKVTAGPQQMSTHIPRSQSVLPSGYGESSHDVAGQQGLTFKIMRRPSSQIGYPITAQDYNHCSTPPWVRSSSALDFLSHSYNQNQQVYRHSKNGDLDGQPGNYPGGVPEPRHHSILNHQPSGHELRSHSALNRRPVVISRKKDMRQTQTSISTSNWAETTASRTLPLKTERAPLAVHDLLAMRFPSQQTVILDQDDTRASETNSYNTNESDPQSHSPGSLDAYDLELYRQQSQHPDNNVIACKPAFSSEMITDDSRINHGNQQKTAVEDDCRLIRQTSSTATEPKNLASKEQKIQDKANFKEQTLGDTHESDKTVSSCNSLKPDHGDTRNGGYQHEAPIPLNNKNFVRSDNLFISSAPIDPKFSQTREESLYSGSKLGNINHTKAVDNVNGVKDVNGSEHVFQSNRKFLLSLSNRTSIARNTNLNSMPFVHNSNNTGVEISAEHASKPSYRQPNNDDCEVVTHDMTMHSYKVLPQPPPRSSKTGEFYSLHLSPTKDNIVETAMEPELPRKRLSQPLTSSPADGANLFLDVTRSTASLKNEPDLSRRSEIHAASPDSLSSSISNMSRLNSTIGSHQSSSKSNKKFMTSTSLTSSTSNWQEAPQPMKLEISRSHYNNSDPFIPLSNSHSQQPLAVTDIDLDKNNDKRKEKTSRIQNEGTTNPQDSLPLTNDELANSVKKRIPFKASIKNFFAKKKFTESDV